MIESNPSIHIYNLLRQWKLQTEPIPKKCCHTVSNFNTQLTRKNPRVMSSSQKLPDSDPDKISKRSTKIQNLRSWNSEETTSTTWCDLILPSVFFRVGGVNHGKMLVVKNWRNKPRISPVLGGIVPANMLPGGGWTWKFDHQALPAIPGLLDRLWRQATLHSSRCGTASSDAKARGAVIKCAAVFPSLKLTAGLPLKIHGWNMNFPLGWSIFRGELVVDLLVSGSAIPPPSKLTWKTKKNLTFTILACM